MQTTIDIPSTLVQKHNITKFSKLTWNDIRNFVLNEENEFDNQFKSSRIKRKFKEFESII